MIFDGVREIVARYEPRCAAVEIVFVNVNPQSTLLLGQARGAAITALVSAEVEVAEYTALQMKKAVVGHGQARKEQVQEMVVAPACAARAAGQGRRRRPRPGGLPCPRRALLRRHRARDATRAPAQSQYKAGRSY